MVRALDQPQWEPPPFQSQGGEGLPSDLRSQWQRYGVEMCMMWPLAQSGMGAVGAETIDIGLTAGGEGTRAQEETGPEAGDC